MPLSEQEQRLLEEMERHLMRNDTDVVSARSGNRTLSYRNLVYGALLLLVGLGGLIAGVAVGNTIGVVIGVIAFAAMVAGVMVAVASDAKRDDSDKVAGHPTSGSPSRATSSASFMDRMNDRWDRRQDGA
ncbi:DUF3040 domain-containing protein [Microbacterium sp. YY-01]|uniref:DUF3040 domain-containing protein n=1 Tax=Microbacterium sp. YY-01 TaxID=3421634 RepID=UPI003D181EF4